MLWRTLGKLVVDGHDHPPNATALAPQEARVPRKRPRLHQIVEEDDSFHSMVTRMRDLDPKGELSSPSTPPLETLAFLIGCRCRHV